MPSAIWYLLNYAFFVVDAYFVGRLGTMALAVSSAIILRIAGSLGTAILAGVGVGIRIDAVVSALVLGLPIVLPTFIGQNAGAGNRLRAGQGIVIGMRQVVIVQAVIAVVLSLFAHRRCGVQQ